MVVVQSVLKDGLRSGPAAFWLAGLGVGGRAPENNRERYSVRMWSASEGNEKPTHGRQAITRRRHDQVRINIEHHVPEALLPQCVCGRRLDGRGCCCRSLSYVVKRSIEGGGFVRRLYVSERRSRKRSQACAKGLRKWLRAGRVQLFGIDSERDSQR